MKRLLLTLLVALAMLNSMSAAQAGTVLANLANDYQTTTVGNTTGAFNSGTGISDTSGTGRWNFYELNGDFSSPSLLPFKAQLGDQPTSGYGGAPGGTESGFNMPAIGLGRFFGDGTTAPTGSLNSHPGNEEPTRVAATWTVGTSGLTNIAGSIGRGNTSSGYNVNYNVRVNGSSLATANVTNNDPRQDGFNLLMTLNAGDTVEFSLGPNGSYAGDESHIRMQATRLQGTLIANAGANYQTATVGTTTAGFNAGSGIADTLGTGRWNYYSSDNANLNATANEQLLTSGNVGNASNNGYGGGLNGFNLPALSSGKIFSDGEVPITNELAIHPANSGNTFTVLRWTAGAGQAGLINVLGNIRDSVDGGNGIDFQILIDGVQVFQSDANSARLPPTFFDVNATISVGSTVDFVLGSRGEYSADESNLAAFITLVVPEPNSVVMFLVGSVAIGIFRRRGR